MPRSGPPIEAISSEMKSLCACSRRPLGVADLAGGWDAARAAHDGVGSHTPDDDRREHGEWPELA